MSKPPWRDRVVRVTVSLIANRIAVVEDIKENEPFKMFFNKEINN